MQIESVGTAILYKYTGTYGAPMSRPNVPGNGEGLVLVPLLWSDDCYDLGGAYWGTDDRGGRIWKIFSIFDEMETYVRACSRKEAISLADIEPDQLYQHGRYPDLMTLLRRCEEETGVTPWHEEELATGEETGDEPYLQDFGSAHDYSFDFLYLLELYCFQAWQENIEDMLLDDFCWLDDRCYEGWKKRFLATNLEELSLHPSALEYQKLLRGNR